MNKCNYGKTVIPVANINFFTRSYFQNFLPQITEQVLYRAHFHGKKTYVLILKYLLLFASVADFLSEFLTLLPFFDSELKKI